MCLHYRESGFGSRKPGWLGVFDTLAVCNPLSSFAGPVWERLTMRKTAAYRPRRFADCYFY
jgi:hypothetical protein